MVWVTPARLAPIRRTSSALVLTTPQSSRFCMDWARRSGFGLGFFGSF
jgi:hypothetical protein